MKYLTSKLQLFSLAFTVAGVTVALMTPLNNAHARNQILTGVIEAEVVCHDGANRGASVDMVLSDIPYASLWTVQAKQSVFHLGQKAYYTRTTCLNLGEVKQMKVRPGQILYPFRLLDEWQNWRGSNQMAKCHDFTIKYVKNGKEVWIQNGGSTVWNITCVAKDGL